MALDLAAADAGDVALGAGGSIPPAIHAIPVPPRHLGRQYER